MLQTTVNAKQGFGLVGSFYDDSARRVAPYNLKANSGVNPKIGNVFTIDSTDVESAVIGGSGVFGGILVSPHEYALSGLAASLELPAGTIGQLCTFGHVVVKSATAVSVGNVAGFDNATGAISAYADAASVPEGSTLIPNAKFILVNAEANGLAVLELGD